MHSSWQREALILGGILVGSAILGAIAGHTLAFLIVGLALYVANALRHLQHLHRWLQSKKQMEIPDAGGVWGDVFDDIRRLEREATRRKDRLTDALARFQGASAAIPDAMVVLSQYDEIEWANQAAERLLGLSWPRDHGQRAVNLLRNPQFTEYLRRGEFAEDLLLQSPVSPELRVSMQIIAYGSSQRLLICRDITHLARLEEMRSHFVANVSHELRTPLTVLRGYLEILPSLPHDSKEFEAYFTNMHEQATRMQRLVDDLLALSRLETSPPHAHETEVDVATMLTGIRSQAHMLSSAGGSAQAHRIEIEAERGLWLRGNPEELHSAFSNLVNNAVRYTPGGGEIRLRWGADAEGAAFSVTDSGEGIAPQHIPHLTERFYRVDSGRSRATGGTGLGLSIVKHILLRHDARLVVDSKLGAGSTFTCRFPPGRVVRHAKAHIA